MLFEARSEYGKWQVTHILPLIKENEALDNARSKQIQKNSKMIDW